MNNVASWLGQMKSCVILCLLLAGFGGAPALATTYISIDEFVTTSFAEAPAEGMLWLKGPEQLMAKQILGHRYAGLRLRYWQAGGRTAWVLDEIGKEHPITMGFVVEDSQLSRVAILEYRESRGGEVRYPFFTQQFVGAGIAADSALSKPIDGISGATMSVRAVTNASRFALYLHDQVQQQLAALPASTPERMHAASH